MHLWFKGCAKTKAGNINPPIISRAGIKVDSSGLISHGHNVFMVHHDACCDVAAEVNLKNNNRHLFICPKLKFPPQVSYE